MKVLVTGVKGQLGYDVIKSLNSRNIENIGAGREEFDITDLEKTREFIVNSKADVVIHCAAYTAVDRAEDEQELCEKVNVIGTKNIATVCKEIDAKMVYISTDYVFPGTGEAFYEVDDATGPLSVYGKTKLQGEELVKSILDKYFIARVTWIFGVNGSNFVKTMLRLGKERDVINVVADQYGSPSYTADIAPLLCDMIMTEKYGTYHVTNEGICSWAEFTEEIFRLAGYDTKVNHITTEEYPTKAARPKNSRLSKEKLVENGFYKLPDWKDALARYLEELK
ncbi:dTDP-4-dehydrorhamnose reductase [Clostridium sp. Marseille-P299]|uniref:dTDP-4-dehydrorhamnose reductase n=1 Tax=Clostridium sp. Marseille-P299 TaxID=1805477 RepID=UPI00082F1189|nr:dTDP-4-dehydrorhamnose reductase [Clostridium sp. Marseille-P299]